MQISGLRDHIVDEACMQVAGSKQRDLVKGFAARWRMDRGMAW